MNAGRPIHSPISSRREARTVGGIPDLRESGWFRDQVGAFSPLYAPMGRRYARVGRLGEGTQGIAYLCEDLWQDRRVVVKLARSDPRARRALQEEVDILWDLQGRYGIPDLEGLLYRNGSLRGYVTRYVAGETLDRRLEQGPIASWTVPVLATSLCRAVLAMLDGGIVHRDLKPGNILCTSSWDARILDFGLARRTAEASNPTDLSGTLAYASPEQLAGRPLTPKSDLFSLGVVLYEIATGQPFFPRKTTSFSSFVALRGRRLGKPLRLEGVVPPIATIIRRLVVESPGLRANVHELRLRLAEVYERMRVA